MSLGVHQKVQAEGWNECHLQTPLGSDCLGRPWSMPQSFHIYHNNQVLVVNADEVQSQEGLRQFVNSS